MRLGSVLTPLSDENLALAAQCGVTDITLRNQGPNIEDWKPVVEQIRNFGLTPAVVEDALETEHIICGGPNRDNEIEGIHNLLRIMDSLEIPVLCYNFMAGTDWVRTRLDVPSRGGARVTEFKLSDIDDAKSLDQPSKQLEHQSLNADELWENLEYFLTRVIPIAQDLGIALAMHPDDPPLDEFMGRARIMNSVEGFERLVKIVDSPSNGICFCQGSFAEIGANIPETIRLLGPHIRYIHFRDIEGSKEDFRETWHDSGPTDMVAAMQAYKDIGYTGPIRPDHVPQLFGEDEGEPGYTQLGRLYAYGYMKGLMQAVGF